MVQGCGKGQDSPGSLALPEDDSGAQHLPFQGVDKRGLQQRWGREDLHLHVLLGESGASLWSGPELKVTGTWGSHTCPLPTSESCRLQAQQTVAIRTTLTSGSACAALDFQWE